MQDTQPFWQIKVVHFYTLHHLITNCVYIYEYNFIYNTVFIWIYIYIYTACMCVYIYGASVCVLQIYIYTHTHSTLNAAPLKIGVRLHRTTVATRSALRGGEAECEGSRMGWGRSGDSRIQGRVVENLQVCSSVCEFAERTSRTAECSRSLGEPSHTQGEPSPADGRKANGRTDLFTRPGGWRRRRRCTGWWRCTRGCVSYPCTVYPVAVVHQAVSGNPLFARALSLSLFLSLCVFYTLTGNANIRQNFCNMCASVTPD